jgi:hypothetical protein
MARATKTLLVTQGSDEANDGTSRYRVETDGTVRVPADVAERLMLGGGFIEVVGEAAPAPSGWAKLRNADGTGCSWGGISYHPDAVGGVTVPSAAVADLASHGFTAADDQLVPELVPEPAAEPAADETET